LSKNPYSAPVNSSYSPQQHPHPQPGYDPAEQLKIPAIFLIIVSAISIINIGSGPLVNVIVGNVDMRAPEFIGMVGGAVAFVLLQSIILAAAINMLRKKQFSLCRLGGILACIPVCSPCLVLGIPFGIWALILLGKPGIQGSFK